MSKAKARKKPMEPQPGYEGAETFETNVHLSARRSERRHIRARPGSFEWRYARELDKPKGDGALYYAGSHFATLFERAGASDPRSPDYRIVAQTGWRGIPDGKAVAMDEVRHAFGSLGKLTTSRLIAYCVRGFTAAELAHSYGVSKRDMAAVLHMDLKEAAVHFRYLS